MSSLTVQQLGGKHANERVDHTFYPEELLLSLKKSPAEFEDEARLLLAVKLYELGRVSTGTAAQLAGMNRVAFMFALSRFGLSPIGLEPGELAEDLANA